jgi:CheY-like chemotaxis protein
MGNRILVVDDEPDILYMVRVILKSAGYEVTVVTGVREAIESISTNEPDLVLLDLRLSDGHGWDVLDSMRADGRDERIPVVILSAHVEGEEDNAIERGARAFVTKPFAASSLIETVQTHLTSA